MINEVCAEAETMDHSADCRRTTAPQPWAAHVPVSVRCDVNLPFVWGASLCTWVEVEPDAS